MRKPTPIVIIKKQKFPVYFGMAALSDFEEKTGIGLSDMSKYAEGMPLKDTLELAYAGLKHGARRMKQKCEFEGPMEVADFLDEDPELLAEVMNVFTKQYAPKTTGKEVKKK